MKEYKITRGSDPVRFEPWQSLGEINDVPLPSREMLGYIEKQGTLRYRGLVLHTLTTSVVERTIIKAIQRANEQKPEAEQIKVDQSITHETSKAYHAPRPLADKGAKGQAEPAINRFMETHDDIELATLEAVKNDLPLSITTSVEKLQRERGFPDRTIGPNNRYSPNEIDWSVAITQIASWSVAGTIQPMDKRFEDLKRRHVQTKDSVKKLTSEELDNYHQWGLTRVADISHHFGIEPDNFFGWLKKEVQEDENPALIQSQSDTMIRRLFDREPEEDEFLPTSPAYRYIADRIMGKRPGGEKLISDPENVLAVFQKRGIIKKEGEIYTA